MNEILVGIMDNRPDEIVGDSKPNPLKHTKIN